jgi:PIN domain nuclease of toxin-antitoxin system
LIILVEKGRVILDSDPATWIRKVLIEIPFQEAPLNYEVAIQSRLIDLPHQDPVDRFLAATAKVYDLMLVTADERLLGSSEFQVLPNT